MILIYVFDIDIQKSPVCFKIKGLDREGNRKVTWKRSSKR